MEISVANTRFKVSSLFVLKLQAGKRLKCAHRNILDIYVNRLRLKSRKYKGRCKYRSSVAHVLQRKASSALALKHIWTSNIVVRFML